MPRFLPLSPVTALVASLAGPLAVAALLVTPRTPPAPVVPPARVVRTDADLQMALGNPDHATDAETNKEHYLIRRPQFAVSYNDDWRGPNWVAWHLSTSDLAKANRHDLKRDPKLPSGFTYVTPDDYKTPGYERGHNCPVADRSVSGNDRIAVSYLTNITLQASEMNRGPWAALEGESRKLAGQGHELFIIMGHGFNRQPMRRVGGTRIAVPDFAWKIIVVVPDGPGGPLERVTPDTRVIAVRLPNSPAAYKTRWQDNRVTVRDLEAATGLSFFDRLPSATAAALRARLDCE